MSGRKTWCKHYRAMSEHDTCSVGVAYDKFTGMAFDDRPCFNVRPDACEHTCYRTPEEIAAEETANQQRFDQVVLARRTIVETIGPYKKGTTPGVDGTIDCPVCGSKDSLRFSRAAYNGHIHAACRTPGCVRWME